jgi:hypothetical protein
MTIKQGSYGKIKVFEDFLGNYSAITPTTTFVNVTGNIAAISVSAANSSLTSVVDEPGGIIGLVTHTDDNDNLALFAGVFRAADGGCWMEARVKMAAITTPAVFVGFSQLMAVTTPVMPLEFATATMTYGAGCVAGMVFDADATTADWRAGFGNHSAVVSGADANGTRAYQAPVADTWDIIKVEIGADGGASCYLNGRLIKHVDDAIVTTDILHAVVMVENRSGATNTLELDYFKAEGGRDWADD